jgi:hypothetical protein
MDGELTMLTSQATDGPPRKPYVARCTLEALFRPPQDQDSDNWMPWSTVIKAGTPEAALTLAVSAADTFAAQNKCHRGRVSIVTLNGVVQTWEGAP